MILISNKSTHIHHGVSCASYDHKTCRNQETSDPRTFSCYLDKSLLHAGSHVLLRAIWEFGPKKLWVEDSRSRSQSVGVEWSSGLRSGALSIDTRPCLYVIFIALISVCDGPARSVGRSVLGGPACRRRTVTGRAGPAIHGTTRTGAESPWPWIRNSVLAESSAAEWEDLESLIRCQATIQLTDTWSVGIAFVSPDTNLEEASTHKSAKTHAIILTLDCLTPK